jgi:hypothetical protein
MPASPEAIRSHLYYRHDTPDLDLEDISGLVGAPANTIRTSRDNGKEVLWEGFFGMFEGPQIARFHSQTRTLAIGGITAAINKQRKTLLGIPLSHDSYAYIESNRQGAMMTALSAYVTKLGTGLKQYSPTISMAYTGPHLDDDPTNFEIQQPFDVPDVTARLIPEHGKQSLADRDATLFFTGRLAVYGQSDTSLPMAMIGQTFVADEVLGSPSGARAIEVIYGGCADDVARAWDKAMAQPTARSAAETILSRLD